MIESGLVYIHYAKSPTAFAGCGALVEGPFIVTCRHVWDEAVKATGDSRNVHIRFRPPGGEGEAKINTATLVDECTSLGGRPDLVILAAEIPAEITAYGLSRAKPQPTRGYAVAGLQRNGPGTTVRGITIWGELAGFIDEGLRQFTGEKDKGFFTDRGSSGSPVIIESTGELAGIVSLSEIGESPGAASIHEAFAVPATIIHRHLIHLVGREAARAHGVDEAKITQILETIGASEITIAELRRRLGLYFENLQTDAPPPLPLTDHGVDIDSALAKSRRLSADFQPADALAVLDATIAAETSFHQQRLISLLEEKARQQRLTYDYEGAKASLGELLALNPDQTWRWIDLGEISVTTGALNDAIGAFWKALSTAERLTKTHPGNAEWQSALAVSHERVGDVQGGQGHLTEALKSYEAALSIRKRLAKTDSENAAWQSDLSISHERIGDVERDQGDLTAALKSYRAALSIRKRLAKTDPANTTWQRSLSISHSKIGDVRHDQDNLTAALKSYRTALSIGERLAELDPRNTDWQRDLSISHERIGNVHIRQDDSTAALKSYQAALAIRERLARMDPGNAGWQRDLSVSHNKIGDVKSDQNDLAEALKSYQVAINIRERLARTDPSNTEWQRDFSVSHEKIGDVQESGGDLPAALKSYQASFAIRDKLAKADPANAGWQRDVALIIGRVAAIKAQQGARPQVLSQLRRGRKIIAQLSQKSPDNAILPKDLAWFEGQIAALKGPPPVARMG